jgi:hypothetical protein
VTALFGNPKIISTGIFPPSWNKELTSNANEELTGNANEELTSNTNEELTVIAKVLLF